jgi:hypothetical protein
LAVGLRDAGLDSVVAATPGAPFEVRGGIPTYHLHSHYPERFRACLSLVSPQTVGARRLYAAPDVVNGHNIHHDLSCG